MDNLSKILQIIHNAPESFTDHLYKVEKDIYEAILNIIKGIDTDSSGNIKPSTSNLKKLNEIKMKLDKILLSKEYQSYVKEFVKEFNVIATLQNSLFESNKPISKNITETAINNTLDTLTGKGYTSTVINKLRDVIQTSIISGGSYKDLTDHLNKLLISSDDKHSIIKKQIQTPAVDALSVFSAEHTKLITDDLGLDWFMYVGSNKTTTREFCEHLTEKKYVHKSEIPSIVEGLIDGHQCKAGKNGLPLGMFEDTNAANFQVNRGGYNCGHQLVPISKEAVPIHLRSKFENI